MEQLRRGRDLQHVYCVCHVSVSKNLNIFSMGLLYIILDYYTKYGNNIQSVGYYTRLDFTKQSVEQMF